MINELNRTFMEVAVMHILAFILIFVVGLIIAACDGNYSGIAAIGKFVLFAGLWLFTQPVLLIIAIRLLLNSDVQTSFSDELPVCQGL